MKLSDFDYELPSKLIAQYPARSREQSRMLVLERETGRILHRDFKDFITYIKPNDILVLNDTKVINARLAGKRTTGGKIEVFLLDFLEGNRFRVLLRPSSRIKEGEEIFFDNSKLRGRLLLKKPAGNIVEFSPQSGNLARELKDIGVVPLPPYIKRKVVPLDSERYQTVYARNEGATAAPTAGLHFTKNILDGIRSKGAKMAHVTLHVSYGTFAPVKSEDIACHKMHSENFELTSDSTDEINSAREKGERLFAVGTTSCRVLETCAGSLCSPDNRMRRTEYRVEARKGKTDLFIYPPYEFKIVDALLTNFHLPKSTLLMLVSAFAGKELIFKAYSEAIEKKYRFFSYGDCMLIL